MAEKRMTTREHVRAAEEAMKKARNVYLAHVERNLKGKPSLTRHRRLLAALQEASDLYFQMLLDVK